MPFMTEGRNLRTEPNGPEKPVSFEPGFEVDIVEEREGWAHVKKMGTNVNGWVPKDTVGEKSPFEETERTIDRPTFFRQCWYEGLSANVPPHYIGAVAQLRSKIKPGEKNGETLPFCFTTSEWTDGRKHSALGLLDFAFSDIKHWYRQCAMFAAMASRDLQLLEAGALLPSAAKLYLAQLIGPKAAIISINSPLDTIDAVLNRVPSADLPLGGLMTPAQILERYAKYLQKNGPVDGTIALARIADDLQEALDEVKKEVQDGGMEVLSVKKSEVPIVTDPDAPHQSSPAIPGQLPNTPQGTPQLPGVNKPGGILGELIASGEGGYGSFNRGIAGDSAGKRIDFSQMTMRDLAVLQSLPRGNPNRLLAVGKYQVVPGTMREAVRALNIGPTETYGPVLQERIFREHLVAGKRPAVKAFITGSGRLRTAQMALAQEFASVADPDTGRSHYSGIAGNRASISTDKIQNALQAEKAAYQALLPSVGAAAAWKKLSPGIPFP